MSYVDVQGIPTIRSYMLIFLCGYILQYVLFLGETRDRIEKGTSLQRHVFEIVIKLF